MLWPKPRFTVRRLMILVTLVALGLGGSETIRRRRVYAEGMEAQHRAYFFDAMQPPADGEDWAPMRKFADYHLAMESKWRQAACQPWLPFEPDLPEPK